MKTEELNDYICRLTEFFAKPRYPKDSSTIYKDKFTAEGHEFHFQESTYYSCVDLCMNCVLTIYPPWIETAMHPVSVRYSVTGMPEDDLELRVNACMDLAWEFVSKVLSGLNMELLTAVRNEETERALAALE